MLGKGLLRYLEAILQLDRRIFSELGVLVASWFDESGGCRQNMIGSMAPSGVGFACRERKGIDRFFALLPVLSIYIHDACHSFQA